jgi:hypothetical protein
MKKLLGLLLFLAVTISGTVTVQAIDHHLKKQAVTEQVTAKDYYFSGEFLYAIHPDYLRVQKGPVYYVRIGDTISLLKDPQGYITAATRMGMETIKVVPDSSGKYYRTVSLDLKQSDEDLKKAIEVKVSDIIVK